MRKRYQNLFEEEKNTKQKNAFERYQNSSEEKKKKHVNIIVNIIRIFLRNKNKGWSSIEEIIIWHIINSCWIVQFFNDPRAIEIWYSKDNLFFLVISYQEIFWIFSNCLRMIIIPLHLTPGQFLGYWKHSLFRMVIFFYTVVIMFSYLRSTISFL